MVELYYISGGIVSLRQDYKGVFFEFKGYFHRFFTSQ